MIASRDIDEYAFINAFRALAAFWVVVAHCMVWGGWYGIPLPSAKIAVDLFMVVSGFLMAANAHARRAREPLGDAQNWLRFWSRRFFRIAPAYYLALTLAFLFGEAFTGGLAQLQALNPEQWPKGGVYDPARSDFSFANFLLHISFLFGLHPQYAYSTSLPDWSLSLEMQFYFVFPALYLALERIGWAKGGVLIGLAAFAVGYAIAQRIWFYEPSFLLFKLQYFIAGGLVFQALTSKSHATIFAGGAVFLCGLEFSYQWQVFVLPMLVVAMLAAGEIELRLQRHWVKSLVRSRLVTFASDMSYSVYLFHGFFISMSGYFFAVHPLSPAVRVALLLLFVTACAYAWASLADRFVERPGIRVGRAAMSRLLPARPRYAKT